MKANRKSNIKEIKTIVYEAASVNVCERTLRTYLHSAGLFGRVTIKKPLISLSNRLKRLSWCKAKGKWTLQKWRRVIWSDEKKFNLFSSDGKQYVWREVHKKLNVACQTPTIKFGGGSVMIWSCFSWYGKGPLVVVDGTLTAEKY